MNLIMIGLLSLSLFTQTKDIDINQQLTDLEWKYYYSFPVESDPWLLAHLITGEGQNTTEEEQRFIASVACNRVKSPLFPNTLKEVIYQPGQYACVNDGNFYRETTIYNWRNAMYVYLNGSVLPEHVVWQSNCLQGDGYYTDTGYHIYCYSNW